MKTNFHHLNRRLHLYLAMFCLPWFIMYGVTSLAFNHTGWFNNGNGQPGAEWKEIGSWDYDMAVPQAGNLSREQQAELLKLAGVKTRGFGGYRPNQDTFYVTPISFTKMSRLVYHVGEKKLVREERQKFTAQFLTGLHARGGFGQDHFLHDAWAFMVDVVCSGFVLWVITGIIIWWRANAMRGWGLLALVGGFASFAGFMLWL